MEWILNGFWVKPGEQQDEWGVTAEKVQIDKGRRRRGKEEEMKKNDYWWRICRKSQFPWPAGTQAARGFLEDNATFETKEQEGGLIYQFTWPTLSGRQQCTQSVLIWPTWCQTCFALIFVCFQQEYICSAPEVKRVALTTQVSRRLHVVRVAGIYSQGVSFTACSGESRSCKTQHLVG